VRTLGAHPAAIHASRLTISSSRSGRQIRSVVFLTGLTQSSDSVPAALSLCIPAFLLRFGFRTLLIFTLYNNAAAAAESDEAVWPAAAAVRQHREQGVEGPVYCREPQAYTAPPGFVGERPDRGDARRRGETWLQGGSEWLRGISAALSVTAGSAHSERPRRASAAACDALLHTEATGARRNNGAPHCGDW
jgi:hypothetical protein